MTLRHRPTRPERHWLAVACADHVAIGREAGFMQVCHGKGGPLRRLAPGDRVVYYSPSTAMGGKDRLRAFTALGRVRAGAPYQAQMGSSFAPFRLDVDWQAAQPAAIAPLLESLNWTRGKANWAFPLRFGLLEIDAADMERIAEAMQADFPPPAQGVLALD